MGSCSRNRTLMVFSAGGFCSATGRGDLTQGRVCGETIWSRCDLLESTSLSLSAGMNRSLTF